MLILLFVVCEICNKKGHLSKNCPTKSKYKSGARIPTDIFRTIKSARGFSKYLREDNYNVTKAGIDEHDECVAFSFDPLESLVVRYAKYIYSIRYKHTRLYILKPHVHVPMSTLDCFGTKSC